MRSFKAGVASKLKCILGNSIHAWAFKKSRATDRPPLNRTSKSHTFSTDFSESHISSIIAHCLKYVSLVANTSLALLTALIFDRHLRQSPMRGESSTSFAGWILGFLPEGMAALPLCLKCCQVRNSMGILWETGLNALKRKACQRIEFVWKTSCDCASQMRARISCTTKRDMKASLFLYFLSRYLNETLTISLDDTHDILDNRTRTLLI